MKDLLTLAIGIAIGFAIAVLLPDPEPIVKTVRVTDTKIVQEEVIIEKDCKITEQVVEEAKQCLQPSLLLDVAKACRDGRLDQSHPDITIIK